MTKPSDQEATYRAYTEQYRNRYAKPGDPGWDAFADFLPSLPLEEQYRVVRFMVANNITTYDPAWIIFALAQQLPENAKEAVETAITLIRNETSAITAAATSVNVSTESIAQSATAVQAAANLISQGATAQANASKEVLARHSDDLRSAARDVIQEEGHQFRVNAINLRRWIAFTAILIAAILIVSTKVGFSWGYDAASRDTYYQIVGAKRQMLRNMLGDRAVRASAPIRTYIKDRLDSF